MSSIPPELATSIQPALAAEVAASRIHTRPPREAGPKRPERPDRESLEMAQIQGIHQRHLGGLWADPKLALLALESPPGSSC